ncbi:hypothetical protein J6590_027140 [Homalodisca vitripennis]|nr:hypothetical protein J6590_027140 [Homalodisca vitripennis]
MTEDQTRRYGKTQAHLLTATILASGCWILPALLNSSPTLHAVLSLDSGVDYLVWKSSIESREVVWKSLGCDDSL